MASTPVTGRPSSQCACRGQAATTRSNTAGSRSALSGVSRVGPKTVTDQVPLSPPSGMSETLPSGASWGPIRRGCPGPAK